MTNDEFQFQIEQCRDAQDFDILLLAIKRRAVPTCATCSGDGCTRHPLPSGRIQFRLCGCVIEQGKNEVPDPKFVTAQVTVDEDPSAWDNSDSLTIVTAIGEWSRKIKEAPDDTLQL